MWRLMFSSLNGNPHRSKCTGDRQRFFRLSPTVQGSGSASALILPVETPPIQGNFQGFGDFGIQRPHRPGNARWLSAKAQDLTFSSMSFYKIIA